MITQNAEQDPLKPATLEQRLMGARDQSGNNLDHDTLAFWLNAMRSPKGGWGKEFADGLNFFFANGDQATPQQVAYMINTQWVSRYILMAMLFRIRRDGYNLTQFPELGLTAADVETMRAVQAVFDSKVWSALSNYASGKQTNKTLTRKFYDLIKSRT